MNVIHSFRGGAEGSYSLASLIYGADGSLFGTTAEGGRTNNGTVFQVSPPASTGGTWQFSTLYSFKGAPDGAYPRTPLTRAPDGSLFGTTSQGGGGGSFGLGVVFQLTPPPSSGGAWTENVIYSFQGAPDGSDPWTPLLLNSNGTLIGAAYRGANNDNGTIFQLNPPETAGTPWTISILHSFLGTDGGNPMGSLVRLANGQVVGTGTFGGAFNKGVVFSLVPPAASGAPWTEYVVHNFHQTDGYSPQGSLAYGSGGLIGVTAGGGAFNSGTVFQLSPAPK